jgi:hypothetical protein
MVDGECNACPRHNVVAAINLAAIAYSMVALAAEKRVSERSGTRALPVPNRAEHRRHRAALGRRANRT